MRIRPPTDRERAALRRALIAAADELGVDRAEPLALPTLLARAGVVVRELFDECVRVDRHSHELTDREIEAAFGSRCSPRARASATLLHDPDRAVRERVMNRYRLAGSAVRYRPRLAVQHTQRPEASAW